MSGLTSMFSSPSKQASQVASAEQGLTAQDLALAKQYANQTATNEQTAIAGINGNPYFSAGASLSPSAYAVNPNDNLTFGANGPQGTSSGSVYATPSSASSPGLSQGLPAGLSTQPVAQNANAQSGNQGLSAQQYLQSAGVPNQGNANGTPQVTPTNNNPFASGSQNTAALEALLGLKR